jgi:hypothetical protein
MIGKTLIKNSFHLLYDRIPECHPLTPHVTLGSKHREKGAP